MSRNRTPEAANVERWDSLASCIEAAKSRPMWGKERDTRFMGATWTEVEKWTRDGWPEGAREASQKSDRIADRVLNSTTAMSLTTSLDFDVAGGCYDVGAYMSGTPECWIRPEVQLTRRAVSIVLNVSASCRIEADTLKRRGMAVASLVMALQAKGYPVTVDVAQVATFDHGYGATYAKVVRVIDAGTGSQLDIDRLVYCIAHPSMFRGVFAACTGDGWASSTPESDGFPPGDYDLKFGGAHLREAERWVDGGEAWIVAEFERQTSA